MVKSIFYVKLSVDKYVMLFLRTLPPYIDRFLYLKQQQKHKLLLNITHDVDF